MERRSRSSLRSIPIHKVFKTEEPVLDEEGTVYYSLQSKWRVSANKPKKKIKNSEQELQDKLKEFSVKFRASQFYRSALK